MNKKNILYLTSILLLIALPVLIWWVTQIQPVFKAYSFKELPGWELANFKKSLSTFQISCRLFEKQNPEHKVGTEIIELQVKDWLPICNEALKINPITDEAAKAFFEKWFIPIQFYDKKPVMGLFTGYYMPTIKGSRKQTAEFNVPIYAMPKDLVTIHIGHFFPYLKDSKLIGRLEASNVVPFHSREEINEGAIKDTARVIAWIHSPIDRLFLEIQGSGVIDFQDGKKAYVGYDGQNGLPYTPIAGVLIKRGILTKDNASMQGIKHYLDKHPEQMNEVLNQNKSFIFFREMSINAAYGSQNVPLTPGYSLAVDRKWIPMGMPLWLSTSRPDYNKPELDKPLHRLMIAQDTGGAIRGKVRGDFFWGEGEKATKIAGHMKNKGYYWLLIPHYVISRLGEYLQH